VLGLVGVASMIVQGGLVGRLVAALGERRALVAGFACGAAGMALYGFAPAGMIFMFGIPLTALYGLSNPSLQSLMTRRVAPTERDSFRARTAA
jgi:DHA1 family tetracycline resistance protein-like MFS transporter